MCFAMNWKTKAALQKLISRLPAAERINYFLQTRITRNLPMSDEVFGQKIKAAKQHLEAFKGHHDDLEEGIVYEFGGGYDLAIPLLLHKAGIKQQLITDIKPLLKPSLVANAAARAGIAATSDLAALGITYKAPFDARKTNLEAASVSYIHSTDTLEHIPPADISLILQECYRILKPGGVISCMIDLQDHYAYFDANLSRFNFYRYSEIEWEKKYNNGLQYQNRLLADDYYKLFALAGFAPIQIEIEKASLHELSTVPLAAHYAGRPQEELLNLRCHIISEKPD